MKLGGCARPLVQGERRERLLAGYEIARPARLDEALALLACPEARVLAGGVSLCSQVEALPAGPGLLVDLEDIPGLNDIRVEDGELCLGALATHGDLENSPVVRHHCPLIAETAAHIADVRVRSCGTIGGNLVVADPAADYPASLAALGARLVLAGAAGRREVPVEEFFVGPFTTALLPGEILSQVRVPVEEPGSGSCYKKCPNPQNGYAIVGVAASVVRTGAQAGRVRVGITGLTSRGFRAREVERLLEGSPADPANILKAAAVAGDHLEPLSDEAASADYRAHLACVYTARALEEALVRAA